MLPRPKQAPGTSQPWLRALRLIVSRKHPGAGHTGHLSRARPRHGGVLPAAGLREARGGFFAALPRAWVKQLMLRESQIGGGLFV